MSTFAESLKKKWPVADELFLHCCARFANRHIRIHFANGQWCTTDKDEYVDIELACIAQNLFVFLQSTTPDCSGDAGDICESTTVSDAPVSDVHDYCSALLSHEWPPPQADICASPEHPDLDLLTDTKLWQRIDVRVHRLVMERPPVLSRFPSRIFKGAQLKVLLEQLPRSALKPHAIFCAHKVKPQANAKNVKKSKSFRKMYACATCGEQHDTRAAVKEHCRYSHGMFPCRSSFCQAMFVSEGVCHIHECVHLKHV